MVQKGGAPMFRDSQEELDRLTEELLEREDLPKIDEDILNDALLKSLLQEVDAVEEVSEDIEKSADPINVPEEIGKKDPVVSVLSGVALLLMTGIFGVLIWWLIQIRSLF